LAKLKNEIRAKISGQELDDVSQSLLGRISEMMLNFESTFAEKETTRKKLTQHETAVSK
jgi:hypothetical protein